MTSAHYTDYFTSNKSIRNNMINTKASTVLLDSACVLNWIRQGVPGPLWCSDAPASQRILTAGQETATDQTQDVILYKVGKLTVKKVTSLDSGSSVLHFKYQLNDQLSWSMQTLLSGHSLSVGIANGELLKGTKEGLTSVLEFAEEKLKINHVFVWFMKSRPDASLLTRTFFCLGFELVKPDDFIASSAGDLRLMVYTIQQIHSSEE
ncbi:LOW QUALITY PROTEIN: ornithine decarboxylase antizyme 2b [Misgurnus anguillicaudatus]|uniref:LOW QUALITY PROTEIN: ornithine decarboxylase antizyme 2b n=1 Tax=Misgurnus anguillicaudatus TaxID=75329 RepID=UPI003CCEFF27